MLVCFSKFSPEYLDDLQHLSNYFLFCSFFLSLTHLSHSGESSETTEGFCKEVGVHLHAG